MRGQTHRFFADALSSPPTAAYQRSQTVCGIGIVRGRGGNASARLSAVRAATFMPIPSTIDEAIAVTPSGDPLARVYQPLANVPRLADFRLTYRYYG